MSITVENELATIGEATAILLEKMPVSKVARLLATLQVGSGDYVKTRDQLFAGGNGGQLVRASQGDRVAPRYGGQLALWISRTRTSAR